MDKEHLLSYIRAEQLRCAAQFADPGARLGLHERLRVAELECGLWVDAVERLRRMEVAG